MTTPKPAEFSSPAPIRAQLTSDTRAPARARDLIAEQLDEVGFDTQNVVLLASELVTNVVRHTTTRVVGLEVEVEEGVMRVRVCDDDQRMPVVQPDEPEHPGGFGLRMVDQLSERWGVTDRGDAGKCVWFEVAPTDA